LVTEPCEPQQGAGRQAMHRRQALRIVAGLALCPLCASVGLASEHHWTYEGEAGPGKWGGLDSANAPCGAGGQQSPIDITGAVGARQPPLQINWESNQRR